MAPPQPMMQQPVQPVYAAPPQPVYAAPPQPVMEQPAPPPPPPPPPAPEPEPEPEPVYEPEVEEDVDIPVAQDIDAMFGEDDEDGMDLDAMDMDMDMEDEGAASDPTLMDEDDVPSAEEIESMFEGEEDPEPMESLMSASEDDAPDYDDPDDIPDELPEVFTSSLKRRKEEKGGGFVKFLMVSLLLIGGLVAGVYFGKDYIVDFYPDAEEYYAMAGLGGDAPGAGLDIRNVRSDRSNADGKDVLAVWGSVINVTDQDRMVPQIRVSLYDARNEEVQFMVVQPAKPKLGASENIGFKAEIEDPVPTARRLEVTFSEEPIMPEEKPEKK